MRSTSAASPPPLPHPHTTTLLQVASKPVESMDEITRPAKRSKGSSSSAGAAGQEAEEEEDIEMVGTKGGSELPHNRFACPEVSRPRAQRVLPRWMVSLAAAC